MFASYQDGALAAPGGGSAVVSLSEGAPGFALQLLVFLRTSSLLPSPCPCTRWLMDGLICCKRLYAKAPDAAGASSAADSSVHELCKRVHGHTRKVHVPGHKQAYERPGMRLLLLDLL